MTKRNWFYTIGSAIATIVIILAIFWLNINKQYRSANILHHIPAQTAYFVKITSLSAYLSATDSVAYSHDLEKIFFSALDSSELDLIKIELETHPELRDLLNRPIHISYLTTPKDSSIKALATIRLEHPGEKSGLEQIMAPITQEVINGANHTIYAVNRESKSRLYCSTTGAILYISESKELIVQAIELPQKESLSANAGFMDIYRTMSSTLPISLIIQPAMAAPTLNLLTNSAQTSKLIAKQVKWIEMDLSFKNNSILASGVLRPEGNGFAALVLKNSPSGSFSLDSVIPSNITKLMHYSKDYRGLANQHFTDYLKTNNLFDKYIETKTQLANRDGFQLEKKLAKLFDAEFAMYTTSHNGKDENCLIMAIPDSAEYINHFNSVFSYGTDTTGKELTLNNGLTVRYYESRLKKEELLFLEAYLPNVQLDYYCQYNQTIVMAPSPTILEQNINSRLQNNTLQARQGYREVMKQLSTEQQFTFFSTSFRPNIGKANKQSTSKTETALQNFGEWAFQISSLHDLMFVSMTIQYTPNKEKEVDCIWQIKTDTLLDMKPTRVINHNTKESEIIFSDKNSNLYLANNRGVVLWKKKIGKAIIGGITQIDFFRNGKLQYLFNDTNHIYLIDRNGNHVPPFPLKLPIEATNGVACFDYENDGDFRFIVAGEDRNIYAFNRKADPLTGFNAPTPELTIKNQIQHFRSSGKDYLVYQDGKTIYITNRRGALRKTINSTISPNPVSKFHLIQKDKKDAAIITTTNKNEWLKIFLATGETEIKSTLFGQNNDHHFIHIPSKNRFIMLLNGTLLMINENGEVEFSSDSGSNHIAEAALVTAPNGQELVTYTDSLYNRLFLVNPNGIQIDGFPVRGNSLGTIINQGNNQELMLIRCITDNIICASPMTLKK